MYHLQKEKESKVKRQVKLKSAEKEKGGVKNAADVTYGRPLSWLRFPTTLKQSALKPLIEPAKFCQHLLFLFTLFQ